MSVTAIVPSAGYGQRVGGGQKKQFMILGEKPMLAHTLIRLAKSEMIEAIVLVAPEPDIEKCENEIVRKYSIDKVIKIIAGGSTRTESVSLGFDSLPEKTDYVLVHDGARPFVTVDMIDAVINLAMAHGAAALAVPVQDTLKKTDGVVITDSIDRDGVVQIQTPQCYKTDLLQKGLRAPRPDSFIPTDESSLLLRIGIPVRIVEGSGKNMKITTADDLAVARLLVQRL